MSSLWRLISGEIQRLIRYKILPMSIAVSAIWIIIFLFISKDDASLLAPLLIFVDISIMSILLIGASHHLEKQEGTIKSMMVMPVSAGEILISKIISSMVLGVVSFIIMSITLYVIHGLTFNYLLMFIFILIAGAAHAAIGFFLAHYSKDFTSMLGWLMAYTFPFALPSILFIFGIIDMKYEWLLMLSPSHAASTLINSAFLNQLDWSKIFTACAYLIILSFILLKLVVYPLFKKNSIKE